MPRGKPLFTFTGRAHGDTAYTLAFSPDGRLLSASGEKTAKLWTFGKDGDSTREFRRLVGHERAVHAAAYSPDGLFIATASADRTVRVWNGAGGGFLRTLTGAKDWIYTVTFTPDSRRVVAGTYDGGVLIWRVDNGVLEQTLATRPGATRLVTASLPEANQEKKAEVKMVEPVKIADGLAFPDGPAYNGKGYIFVSNCNADTITRLDDASNKTAAFHRAVDKFTFLKTNGMTFYEDGTLFACDFERKAILQIHPDGRMELYADKCDDQGFKGPNDLAFDPEGNLYFTDPTGSDEKNPVGCVSGC
jgi:WD40 repeat protein